MILRAICGEQATCRPLYLLIFLFVPSSAVARLGNPRVRHSARRGHRIVRATGPVASETSSTPSPAPTSAFSSTRRPCPRSTAFGHGHTHRTHPASVPATRAPSQLDTRPFGPSPFLSPLVLSPSDLGFPFSSPSSLRLFSFVSCCAPSAFVVCAPAVARGIVLYPSFPLLVLVLEWTIVSFHVGTNTGCSTSSSSIENSIGK